jgi:hypothetical protein
MESLDALRDMPNDEELEDLSNGWTTPLAEGMHTNDPFSHIPMLT